MRRHTVHVLILASICLGALACGALAQRRPAPSPSIAPASPVVEQATPTPIVTVADNAPAPAFPSIWMPRTPEPQIIQVVTANNSAGPQCVLASDGGRDRLTYGWCAFWATVEPARLTAMAAVLGALVLLGLWLSLRRARETDAARWIETRRSLAVVEDAARSMSAALLATEASADRIASVAARAARPFLTFDMANFSMTKTDGRAYAVSLVYSLRNQGRSIAFDVQPAFHVALDDASPSQRLLRPTADDTIAKQMLAPGQDLSGLRHEGLVDIDIGLLKVRRQRIFLHGVVTYTDGAGAKHETEYCRAVKNTFELVDMVQSGRAGEFKVEFEAPALHNSAV